jgi:hypothetical protein
VEVEVGFRFRKSVKIMPGVRLNLGRRGVSATIGRRGASVTVGKRGTYANVGLPGTGMSYRERLDLPGNRVHGSRRGGGRILLTLVVSAILIWIVASLVS